MELILVLFSHSVFSSFLAVVHLITFLIDEYFEMASLRVLLTPCHSNKRGCFIEMILIGSALIAGPTYKGVRVECTYLG